MSYRNSLGVSLVALAMAFGAPAAMAQADAAADAGATADAETSFTDEQLSTYAETHAKVEALNQDYEGRISGAATPDDKEVLTNEKNQMLSETVQKSGLSVEEYNQIYMATQADPALAAKVDGMAGGMPAGEAGAEGETATP
jgi:hypothetical protein